MAEDLMKDLTTRYAMTNISSDSYVTVNHATKTIAKSR